MSIDSHQPTTYPDVNAVLGLLLSNVRSILGERFVGLYLCGSLASGDFDPHSSDIDFVVVTTDSLPDEIISALKEMHARLIASGLTWIAKLEGSYITRSALHRYNPADGPFPCINEGEFYLAHHESHWIIQRWILREQGVVVAGPNPKSLIDPVERSDIQQAVLGFLHEWWSPMLIHSTRLQSTEYQAYAVLTMCRALYTLETDTIASKPVAAHWAQITTGEPWSAFIDWALSWQAAPYSNRMNEALDFIKYTLDRSRQYESS